MTEQKYAIFAGYNYDASGGFFDIYDFSDTLEEATLIYNRILADKIRWCDRSELWKEMNPQISNNRNIQTKLNPFQWAHVVDLQTKKILLGSKPYNK